LSAVEIRMVGGTRFARKRLAWLAAAAVGTMAILPVHAADPCDGFTWNVAHERAVFATPAVPVTAMSAAGPGPTLGVDKLYEIALTPQEKVSFVMAPAKKALAEGAYAGMVTLHIPSSGKYRVSLSEGFWIDAIADGKFVPTDDFTGAHDCRSPRKIVQFLLSAGDVVLQFANANAASLRVTVTAAPK
jgi:hypothetical protein